MERRERERWREGERERDKWRGREKEREMEGEREMAGERKREKDRQTDRCTCEGHTHTKLILPSIRVTNDVKPERRTWGNYRS